MDIDWTAYRETFPDRYIQPGELDELVSQILLKFPKPPAMCLDIGGGTTGTSALRSENATAFTLDPHVSPPPWQTPITWDTKETFDLIVARGSINYLTVEELRKIPRLLKPQGRAIFNTFLTPKEISRPFHNSLSGTSGTEFTRIQKRGETETIHHTLQISGGQTIEHTFFHHPLKLLLSIFSNNFQSSISLNNNSLLCRFKKL